LFDLADEIVKLLFIKLPVRTKKKTTNINKVNKLIPMSHASRASRQGCRKLQHRN